jgi:hypothetical protein
MRPPALEFGSLAPVTLLTAFVTGVASVAQAPVGTLQIETGMSDSVSRHVVHTDIPPSGP